MIKLDKLAWYNCWRAGKNRLLVVCFLDEELLYSDVNKVVQMESCQHIKLEIQGHILIHVWIFLLN